ncbi:alpha/beta fold hydrolase [Streptomyces sp. NPDC001744]|uniref:alpha/beta fold hydrolase n=1 Tax=Streptomyces sp. NPDC001744 TaxID=3364606 RepID=UPI0036935947
MATRIDDQKQPVTGKHVTVDGVRVHYYESGSGDPVVFLHGIGGSADNWWRAVAKVGRTHHAIAIDLPGYGRSDPLPDDVGAERTAAFLWRTVEEIGLSHPVLVGHSFGGLLSLMISLDHPGAVRGMVLISSGGLGRTGSPSSLALAFTPLGMVYPWLARLPFGPEALVASLAVSGACRPWRLPHLWWRTERKAASSYTALRTTVRDLRKMSVPWGQKYVLLDRLRELPMPCLTLWGTHDQMTPFWHAIAADRRLRHGTLRFLPFTGHLLPSEAEGRFLRHLLDFLGELPAAPAPSA